jgi:RHS repeat-associated protein
VCHTQDNNLLRIINRVYLQHFNNKAKEELTRETVITTTDYAGKSIYQNNALQMINQPEGYMEPNGLGTYDYGYRLKVGAKRKSRFFGNHLGNIRLTFVDFDHNGSIALSEITEENNYYPFGLKHQGYNNTISSNANAVAGKFKYNGKELSDELGLDLYDYGARFYNAALGRFHTVDPLAAKFPWQSTYVYADNNPIRYIDVNGMASGDPPWGATYALGLEHAGMSSTQASAIMQWAGRITSGIAGAAVVTTGLVLTSETWVPVLASGSLSAMTGVTAVNDAIFGYVVSKPLLVPAVLESLAIVTPGGNGATSGASVGCKTDLRVAYSLKRVYSIVKEFFNNQETPATPPATPPATTPTTTPTATPKTTTSTSTATPPTTTSTTIPIITPLKKVDNPQQ